MSVCSRMWLVARGSSCGGRQLSAWQSAWNFSVHCRVTSPRERPSSRARLIVLSSTSVKLRTCLTLSGPNSSSSSRRIRSLTRKVRKLPMCAGA